MIRKALSIPQLLDNAAEEFGYANALAMLSSVSVDNVVPGICRSCGTLHDEVEPDATGYDCDDCGASTVDSVLILAGLI